MKEYKNPIRMRSDDPICSASALGNTIIGILFDKKGSEIQNAITARTEAIDGKVKEYESTMSKIDGFVEGKKLILKELDEYYQDRSDKKNAQMKPYRDDLEKVRKEYDKKINDIGRGMKDNADIFDEGTAKEVGKKALEFEKSFDDFKATFSDVAAFLEQEKNIIAKEPVRGIGYPKGLQGSVGSKGVCGTEGTSSDNVAIYNTSYTQPGVYTSQITPTEEDEATERLDTLRSLLAEYARKLETLKDAIQGLIEERRRLKLISNNINPDREYKLDLNKLSAFGFEDIEVK